MSDDLPVALSRFRADVARAVGRRGKALLEAADLEGEIAALEPLEAYFIIKELGVDEAVPILRHATAEQLRACIDLDCWRDGLPDPVEVDAWLGTFAHTGREALAEAFLALDPELQVLFLKSRIEVYDARSENAPPEPQNVVRTTTPDGLFIVDVRKDDALEIDLLALLDGLYARGVDEVFRLLTACKWELTSELEETAAQFRAGRLEDLGFPPPERARAILAPPPHEPPPRPPGVRPPATTLPALYAEPLREGALLSQALACVRDTETLAALETDLIYLINAAVIVLGESVGDLAQVSRVAERVRDTVSLGLEVVGTPGGLDAVAGTVGATEGAELLLRWPARALFAHGHHAVRPLAEEARALAASDAGAAWLAQPETERSDYGPERMDRELVRALLETVPLYGGWDPLAPVHRRAFATLRDVATAGERLRALAGRLG